MVLIELMKVLPKPAHPHGAVIDSSQWRTVENELNIQFPIDFKEYIGIY